MRVSLCLLLGLSVLPAYAEADAEKHRLNTELKTNKNSVKTPGLVNVVVSVTLNESKKGDFFIYVTGDGDYLVKVSDLAAMDVRGINSEKLTIENIDYFSLKSITGFNISFDENNLALKIISAPALLNKI